jgi:DNA replication and repair protein RecF
VAEVTVGGLLKQRDNTKLPAMFLKHLSLTNFKNYSEANLDFCPRINCFVGDNGVGKTNILDAIHYLSLTKSYFTTVDSANIRHGSDYFLIKGFFDRDGVDNEIYCGFQKDKRKTFKIGGKEYERLADHIGRLPAVMVSPADSVIITGGSEERRKFMNSVISQFDREYLANVMDYNKALKTRNRMLKDGAGNAGFDSDLMEIWEKRMGELAEGIFKMRDSFTDELIPLFRSYYSMISGNRELVDLTYLSQLRETGFLQLIKRNYRKDRILHYTSAGVHRDDLLLGMGGYPVRDLGSQGQQKSYLVALKLAKYDYIASRGGEKPILLLDDIFDKFDENRVEQIIELVSNHRFGQIFITDTHSDRMNRILSRLPVESRLFVIKEGIAEVIEPSQDIN